MGRRRRTVSGALRRALEVRDRGCRFPDHSPPASGARGLRFTDGHYIVHWADGGETSLGNTVLLCGDHHRLVHEDGWSFEWWGGEDGRRAAFRDPRGQVHIGRPPRPPELGPDPLEELIRQHRRRGVVPDPDTAGARWRYARDIPDEVYFRATEAVQ